MDLNASASYEFLDLSDIEENDKKRLICTLYNKNINNNQISTTQEDIKLNNLKDSGIIITSSLPLLPLPPQSSQATSAATITTTTTTIKKHHNNTVNGSSASSFSNNNNNSKEFNNNKNSRFINESNHNNNKHVKNIATNKYSQHISSSHEKSSSSGHVIQNLMIPRFITPVALPFCAVVKPNLADIKLVPLRTPISTASAAVKPHAEQAKVFCKPFTGNILSSTTMPQHNQMLVTQQQSQQQQQQQQQPVPPLSQQSQQQQQQQILNTQAQVQSNQQSQQALSQNNNYPPSQFPQTHAAFNQVPPGGVYMHPHGAQPIGIYHMLPASPMPSSSVYVNNVTANVNLHGCPYIPGIGPFIPGEVQQNVSHVTEQNSGTSVQNTMNNSMPRNQRRNRGRGNGNNRRNDYNQRQQQASASPSPQEVMNSQVDPQALGGYMQYGYPYSYCGTPPQNVAHLQAQQAAGSPIYVPANSIPMFAPMQQIYGYPGLVYHPTMIPQEYSMMDEKGEEHPEGVISEMWQMRIYSEDYLGHEMVEDVNHNPSSITSSETPSMLSPSYPIYDNQMQSLELQHQMNAMHIYEPQLPQPLPVENQIQEIVVNSQPHEQILDHSSIVPVEDGNLISDQQQNLDVNEELNKSETSEGNMIKTPLETSAVYVPPPTPPQQQPEQNTSTFTTTMENQSVQQLPTNVTVAVIKQQQVVEEAPTFIERNDNITEKDLNQSVSNSTEYQQTSDISTNDKQADNEIPNVPTVNDHNAPVRSSNVKMSWTNQNKKSTASVAVTATPASNNKSSNLASKSAINTSSNQNSVSQTVQVKNYGVMKTPSSPAATNENNNNNIEKKTNQNEVGKQISTTSTASSVVPQQFQEVKSSNSQSQQFNNEAKTETQSSEPAESKVKNDTVTSATNANTNTAANANANVPQTVSQGPLSWASLFANKSSTFSTTATPQNNTPHNYPPQSKKPVAKVLPFEGTSNFVAPTTPGNMSYSAASAQGHASSQSNANNSNSMKFKPSSSSSLSGPSATSSSNLNRDSIDEWSIKFADFLTKHKIDYSPISLKPRGLTNRSNYCYINAILQALVGCPPFYNLMKAIPRQTVAMMSEKTNTPTINAMMQLISEFSHLPHGARLNRREKGQKKDDLSSELSCDPSFEPTSVYKLWNTSRSDVVEGRQEDAEEFLGYVLNKLNDEMLEIIKLVSKPKSEQNGEVNLDGDDGGEDWQMIYNNRNKGSITRQTDFGRTPISDIFRGELRSRLQREGEYSVTDVIQPFYTLQLNIEKAASVKEALEILVGRDQLEGVTCSKTNQKVTAWQQMNLEKLPVVLILHLKWFDYKMDGCTKIIKTVEFPVELRIDTKILASKKYSQKQKLYRLFAVVYHDGKEASKGHYITDVYHTGYSSWLRYDDSSVKPVSENNVLRPRTPRVPYLLYYRRCDTVPVQNAANHK